MHQFRQERSPYGHARSGPGRGSRNGPEHASLLRPVGALDPPAVLALQRLAGNQAVTGMLSAGGGAAVRSLVDDAVGSGRTTALPAPVRTKMESATGHDLSGVQVHADRESTEALGAKAYTFGEHIVTHPAYSPGSSLGDGVLAHEAAHVVQQRTGPVSGDPIGAGLAVSRPGDYFERQADGLATGAAGKSLAHPSTRAVGGRPAVLQRALLDDAESLERAETAVGGMKPAKRSLVGKIKDKVGRLFGRSPKRMQRTGRDLSHASGQLGDAIDRIRSIRARLRSEELGPVGSRRTTADEVLGELGLIGMRLAALEEHVGSIPEIEAAVRALEEDRAAVESLASGDIAGSHDDMPWLEALQRGQMGEGQVAAQQEMTRVAALQPGFQQQHPDNPGEVTKMTTANLWRSGTDAARDYVKQALSGGIVARATATAISTLRGSPDYATPTDHGSSTPDDRVWRSSRAAMQAVAPVFFASDAGWVPERVARMAGGVLAAAEQQFGPGPIADAAVVRLVAWIGAQTQFQVATVQGLPAGTVGQKGGLEMHRALMEICFERRANSDQSTYDIGWAYYPAFRQALLSRIRDNMPTPARQQLGV